jgi:hypothetical protein
VTTDKKTHHLSIFLVKAGHTSIDLHEKASAVKWLPPCGDRLAGADQGDASIRTLLSRFWWLGACWDPASSGRCNPKCGGPFHGFGSPNRRNTTTK